MSDTAMPAMTHGTVPGTLNYLVPAAQASLYRNGSVRIDRDLDGNSTDRQGVNLEERVMPVHDARQLPSEERRTLAANGFELLTQPLADPDLDFLDHAQVIEAYYLECVQIVRDTTGAAQVFAFDHNVRSAVGKSSEQRIAGGQQVQGPAQVVHGDYTLTSAPTRLSDLSKPPSANDTLRSLLAEDQSLLDPRKVEQVLESGRRFAIINVWRNIAAEPVETYPLALCDAQSVAPDDLVVFEIHYHDRVGENYFAKHASRHQWYFYPRMTRDEVLLIKQWDSDGPMAQSRGAQGDAARMQAPCTFSFHSSFSNPETPADAPGRWSIEVRCVVLYDD